MAKLFKNMDDQERQEVMKWARWHDWAVDQAPRWDGDDLVTASYASYRGGPMVLEEARHGSMRALRAWAGY